MRWRGGAPANISVAQTAQHPEYSRGAPPARRAALARNLQTLADWSRLYIKYAATLRKLAEVQDLVAHPQKRRCVGRMLGACVGRLLEVRAWLVSRCS